MADFVKVGSEILVNTATAGDQYSPQIVALAAGGYVVTWVDGSQGVGGATGDTSGTAIKAQVFAWDGAKIGGEIRVNAATVGDQSDARIAALPDGGFIVSWTDGSLGVGGTSGDSSGAAIKAQMFGADGTKVGTEILVNTATSNNQQISETTTLSNGGFVITWSDSSAGIGGASGDASVTAVKAQVFAADGVKVGTEILVNTAVHSFQGSSFTTALANGGFVVTWQDLSTGIGGATGDTSNIAVKAQVFAAGGAKVGTEILVNTATVNIQSPSDVTPLSNGGFVVTWLDFSAGVGGASGDASGTAVKAQVFAADGSKLGTEILVNTATANDQRTPEIAPLSTGGFVVSWTDHSYGVGGAYGDPSAEAIKAQIFAADGAKLGSEILVNTTVNNAQFDPDITALAGGGFSVTWFSFANGASMAQVFSADGTKVGSELIVSTTGSSDRSTNPEIVGLSNGGFAVSWAALSFAGPDASRYAVRAQVFAPSDPIISAVEPDNGVSMSDGLTNSPLVTVIGAAAFGGQGHRLNFAVALNWLGTATVDSGGKWRVEDVLLAEGSNNLVATVIKPGSPPVSSPPFTVTLDTIAPSLTIGIGPDSGESASDRITNVAVVNLHGTLASADIGRPITIYSGETLIGAVQAAADGSWSLSGVTLSEGSANLTARVTDRAGNTATSSLLATLDTTAPMLAITQTIVQPETLDVTIKGTIGAADAGRIITITDGTTLIGTTTADADGHWSLAGASLAQATNSLVVFATDTAGNTGVVQYVYGTADGMIVGDNSIQYVFGTSSNSSINAGGQQNVVAGGTAAAAILHEGGVQIAWGNALGTIIAGGTEYIWGTASDTALQYGSQVVLAGGAVDGTVIDGGIQAIYTDGHATNTTIHQGGAQHIWGRADGTFVDGGSQFVYTAASDTTIVNGGRQSVFGVADVTTVGSGGQQHVYGGGFSLDTTINAGGVQIAWGTAIGTIVNGGDQYLWGSSLHTTLAEGAQYIQAQAKATDTVIESGAVQFVYTAAIATQTAIMGGTQYVYGDAQAATVADGGIQYVFKSASATIVNDGGLQDINAGAAAFGTTINAGGVAHLHSGGEMSGAVTFGTATGTLVLDTTTGLKGSISGFEAGDIIDFRNVDYEDLILKYTENFDGSGGTLLASDGLDTILLSMIGDYDAADFYAVNDGLGGALVKLDFDFLV